MDYSKLTLRLENYLNSTEFREPTLNRVRVIKLELYGRQGLSNTIYTLEVEDTRGFTRELILRVYPGDGKKALKEFRILNLLHDKGIPVPKVYAFDESGEVLGKPFIIMEKIQQSNPPDGYVFIDAAAKSLVGIHSVTSNEIKDILKVKKGYPICDLKEIEGLMVVSMLTSLGKPWVFTKIFNYAKKLESDRIEFRLRLIHGDYGFDNIIYSDGKAYVIDWENAEIAEPTFDVAYAYNFLEFDDEISGRTDRKLSEAFIESYERYGGTILEFQFYRKLAALKLLAILEAVSHFGFISLIAREFRRRTSTKDAKQFIEVFKKHLRDILNGKS